MSSFKRYKEPPANEKKSIFKSGIEIDFTNFTELYSAAACWSSITQKRAGDLVVRGREWFIDFNTGILHFGMDRYPFQVIGTESVPGRTWLWSWANGSIENEDTLRLADRLYSFGEEWGLSAFCEPQYELTQVFNGYTISAVAAMLSEKPVCFYRCPHETGAVFAAFGMVPKDVFAPVSAEVFINVLMALMQQTVTDHKVMAEGFLFHNQTPYHYRGNDLVAEFVNKPLLYISFDKFHRIIAINSR